MTVPLIAPIRDRDELAPVSRCLLHYRAGSMTARNIDNTNGIFTRAKKGYARGANGFYTHVGYNEPVFEAKPWPLRTSTDRSMMLRVGSYEFDSYNLGLDRIAFEVAFPPIAMGFIHEFVQDDPTFANNDLSTWSIRNDDYTGQYLQVTNPASSGFSIHHYNGSVSVVSTLASGTLPVAGDCVVHYGYMYSDGSVQLFQSINGGAFVAAARSGACDPTTTAIWGRTSKIPYLWLSSENDEYASYGIACWHRTFKFVAGQPSLAQMQQVF